MLRPSSYGITECTNAPWFGSFTLRIAAYIHSKEEEWKLCYSQKKKKKRDYVSKINFTETLKALSFSQFNQKWLIKSAPKRRFLESEI